MLYILYIVILYIAWLRAASEVASRLRLRSANRHQLIRPRCQRLVFNCLQFKHSETKVRDLIIWVAPNSFKDNSQRIGRAV